MHLVVDVDNIRRVNHRELYKCLQVSQENTNKQREDPKPGAWEQRKGGPNCSHESESTLAWGCQARRNLKPKGNQRWKKEETWKEMWERPQGKNIIYYEYIYLKTRKLEGTTANKRQKRKWYQFLKLTWESIPTFNQSLSTFPDSNVPFGWAVC